jgi:hypothetical protein
MLGLVMIGLAVKNYLRMGLVGIGVLGVALMVMVTGFIIPGIQAEGSPRLAFDENQRRLNNQTDPISVFQSWDWRGDEDEFYWDYLHGHSRIVGKGFEDSLALEELKRDVQQSSRLVMMTKDQYHRVISGDQNLNVIMLFEFYRSKKNIVLLSLGWRTQDGDSLKSEKQ